VAFVLWLAVVIFWRYSSLGSIIAAVALPVLVYILYAPRHAPPLFVTLGTVFISMLILFKHRANIERLVAGNEARIKFPR
jgi:glycerol-3-phosphate acyltransferase PlsY